MLSFLRRISLESLYTYSLLSLAALLPIFVVPGLSFIQVPQTKMFLAALGVTISFVAWVALSLSRKSLRAPKDILLIVAAGLPLAYIVSALATGWSSSSFVGGGVEQDTVAAALLWYGALILSAIAFFERRNLPARFLRVTVVSGGCALLLFIFKMFLPELSLATLWGVLPSVSSNTLGSWHDLNILAGLVSLVGLAYVLERTESHAWRVVGACAAGIGLFVLAVGRFSDVLLVYAIFALLYAGYCALQRRALGTVRGVLAWGVIGVCVLALFFGRAWVGNQLPAALVINELEVRPSWQGTFAVGQRVFSGEGSRIFGAGPNSFAEEWGRYKPSDINNTIFWGADFTAGIGAVPTSFVTTGALGVLAWLLLLGGFLFSAYTAFRSTFFDERARQDTLLLGASGLYLMLFHVVYVPGAAVSVLTFLMLGAFVAARSYALRVEPVAFRADFGTYPELARSVLIILAACAIFAASLQSIRSIISNIFVNRAVQVYQTTGSLNDAQAAIARALVVYGDNDRAHRAAVELGILTLQNLVASGGTDDISRERLQSELAATVTHGLSAVALNEKNYQNWLTLAQLYQSLAGVGVEGAYEAGKQAFERARTESPTHPLPSLRLAQLEILAGNTDAAYALLDEAIGKKADFAEAHFIRSQLLAQQGRFEDAEAAALAAARFAPQDPLAWYNVGAILFSQGAYAEAVPPLEQAVLLRPDYANAIFILALSQSRMNNTAAAILLLQRVLELNPGNADVKNMIATLSREAGE